MPTQRLSMRRIREVLRLRPDRARHCADVGGEQWRRAWLRSAGAPFGCDRQRGPVGECPVSPSQELSQPFIRSGALELAE
jgi:hypothetical protein